MAKKINVKLILELLDAGMSRNDIAASRHIARDSISEVRAIAKERNIRFCDVQGMEENDLYRMFFPDRHSLETMYRNPDYDYIHKELRKVGVTLKLLWQEYKDSCKPGEGIAMGYTKFCEGYGEYTISSKLTNHLEHKPGIITEVDSTPRSENRASRGPRLVRQNNGLC